MFLCLTFVMIGLYMFVPFIKLVQACVYLKCVENAGHSSYLNIVLKK